ncbi:DUF6895 family protein [Spongiactinospora sp. 9N601]|uniref:DUF6895 family protein n=1 Tax=Spongiactinospora sp. 9N601 TaxID=3375149 RepID=UPI0037CA7F28
MTDAAARSAAWVTGRLGRLVPAGAEGAADAAARRLTELALVEHQLARRAPARFPRLSRSLDAHLDTWRAVLTERTRAASFARAARARPAEAVHRVQPYLWLRAGGHRSAEGEELLGALIAGGARPRSPGQTYALWRAGCLRRAPDWAGLWRSWVLGLAGRTATADGPAVYDATHAIFYGTDFGFARPGLTPAELSASRVIVGELLRRCLALHAWDAVLELALCAHLLGEPFERCARALREVETVRHTDGSIPSSRAYEPGGPPAPDALRLSRICHATLVHTLTCVTLATAEEKGGIPWAAPLTTT